MRISPCMDSRNMRTVKELWTVFEHDGLAASTEAMLSHASEDLEVTPFAAGKRILRGPKEVREHLTERAESGVTVDTNAWSFEEDGDKVIVSASVRVHRPDGSLADAQVKWVYDFDEEGRVNRATFAPYGEEP
jgi:hypothetical protein